MVQGIYTIIDFMSNIVSELDRVSFDAFGFSVTLIDIFIGFIALSMIVSIFWKGARG